MKYLLDTNACIHHLKFKDSPVTHRLNHEILVTAISSVTRSELFFGAMMSNRPTESLRQQQVLVRLLTCLSFDQQAALIHGKIRSQLQRAGTPIGPYDSQIAAVALAYDLILVTHNVREFERVENLKIEDWEAES